LCVPTIHAYPSGSYCLQNFSRRGHFVYGYFFAALGAN
jgi:hypothetical protein